MAEHTLHCPGETTISGGSSKDVHGVDASVAIGEDR